MASTSGFAGAVLDAGCGTGENALHVASLGLSVLGVDVAATALAIARENANKRGMNDRGIKVEFVAADAFQLERLSRRFRTVLDCGLFHTFNGDERPRYVASLASVTELGGTLYVLCFSDEGPDTGPHPVSQEELRAAFNPNNGWNVAAIGPERIRRDSTGTTTWRLHRSRNDKSQTIGFPTLGLRMRELPNAKCRLDEHLQRALNKIRKPGTAEEITEMLNRNLDPGNPPFQVKEVSTWLRNAADRVLQLYWLESRPRR